MDGETSIDKAEAYKRVRDSSAVSLGKKHLRQFDDEFLTFCGADNTMSVLDIGCGVGVFLSYLKHRGFQDIAGIDYDENLATALQPLKEAGCTIEFSDAESFVDKVSGERTFDRIVLFDILEHMPVEDSVKLLRKLRSILADDGRILIRVPNVTSPWGLRMQFDCFDHVTMFSPGRLGELAIMSGYKVRALKGQTTGKRRKVIIQNAIHYLLSRILTYHPEVWEAAIVCTMEPDDR